MPTHGRPPPAPARPGAASRRSRAARRSTCRRSTSASPRPEAFLGYPLGARFTSWDRIVAYLEALDAASPRVKMWEYGHTYEGRPLKLLAVSAPENLERLEEIRKDVLRLADPAGLSAAEKERILRRTPLVVWLAYGVHGNESSSAEAAMGTAYVLAAAQGETAEMLEDVVVLIDPLQNPDGRERYVNGYRQRRGDDANPRRAARRALRALAGRPAEPLPDRPQPRLGVGEPAGDPAADRRLPLLGAAGLRRLPRDGDRVILLLPARRPSRSIRRSTAAILSWLDTFGRANAAAFDRQGWIYFKEENYDLFYPGYGDSYPSLRGAVGMTYEMAGGGRAGVALTLPDGTVLTLADRVARHLTTSLTTVRTAARNGRKLLADFAASRAKPAAEPARTYLWPADQPEARALADLLALHGVQRAAARAAGRDPGPRPRQGERGRGAAAQIRGRHLRRVDRPAARQPGRRRCWRSTRR